MKVRRAIDERGVEGLAGSRAGTNPRRIAERTQFQNTSAVTRRSQIGFALADDRQPYFFQTNPIAELFSANRTQFRSI